MRRYNVYHRGRYVFYVLAEHRQDARDRAIRIYELMFLEPATEWDISTRLVRKPKEDNEHAR